MANRDFTGVAFSVSTASGSAVVDVSQQVETINGLELTAITQESHAMGDAWVEHLYAGIRRMEPLTIGGFEDDDGTTGLKTILGAVAAIGGERTLKVRTASNEAIASTCLVQSYRRIMERNSLNRFECTLLPKGTPTTST